MKIDALSANATVFSDIKVGDAFWVGKRLYLKIGTYLTVSENRYTAVNIETGSLIDIYDDDVIIPAKVRVVNE